MAANATEARPATSAVAPTGSGSATPRRVTTSATRAQRPAASGANFNRPQARKGWPQSGGPMRQRYAPPVEEQAAQRNVWREQAGIHSKGEAAAPENRPRSSSLLRVARPTLSLSVSVVY